MAGRLTKAQKAELAPLAVEKSARGQSYRLIADDLGVNWRTVGKLIDDELAARAEHRANDTERHLSVYDRVQKAAWELYDSAETRSMNKATALNTILSAEQAKVKLTGAESAAKVEHSGPGGGPIPHEHSEKDERFERLFDKLGELDEREPEPGGVVEDGDGS